MMMTKKIPIKDCQNFEFPLSVHYLYVKFPCFVMIWLISNWLHIWQFGVIMFIISNLSLKHPLGQFEITHLITQSGTSIILIHIYMYCTRMY